MRYRPGADSPAAGDPGAAARAAQPQRWTQTDITDLRRRLALGETESQIADGLMRPQEDIRRMAARLGLLSRLIPPQG
ncbi:hypothetical protein [Sphingomonas sanxanigenens]|uniref:Uncharacterized protein n=1 Tax=Sphingomonas sanxanigenens DSM 19645 = NX02 TaxID=1123269 RepID=W0A632_9SPHN|nr:hypothetical protein [Sphingomonas sanxanigenens]AHE52491.1 hypothetical protein NX02_03685 [Sphingomonas sanxanigenens DSM 19645 = NX02]